jgi:hypothetical protein
MSAIEWWLYWRREVWSRLYWRLFGDGQAYRSPVHAAIADWLKALARRRSCSG